MKQRGIKRELNGLLFFGPLRKRVRGGFPGQVGQRYGLHKNAALFTEVLFVLRYLLLEFLQVFKRNSCGDTYVSQYLRKLFEFLF